MRKLLTLIITAITLSIAGTSYAQALETSIESAQEETSVKNLVQIRLIAEQNTVKGDDEIWIGIEKTIADHWHTYWVNPGDSGTITKAKWTPPKGFEFSDIQWPTPKRLPYGSLMNYGYENNVTLLQKLKLPQNIPNGAITLLADIELLVCKEECIPEYGTYALTLNDGEKIDNSAYFENAISKLPVKVDWESTFKQDDKNLRLTVNLPKDIANDIKPETLQFFPRDWGLVQNAKPQSALLDGNTLKFIQNKGERDFKELEASSFIITYQNQQNRTNSFEINASSGTPNNASFNGQASIILKSLLFALLGGIILNLMPCVFPVLSIKALSLVKIADKKPSLARLHGLSYTGGVILSFLVIAGTLLILKATGAQIGWGFQLQSPIVVGALAYLLFLIGLNLLGYFELNSNFGNFGNKLTQNNGLTGSFFTGILATLVATPCTAPFMAAAIGFALTQGAIVNLLIFTSLGLGLALPYLALSFAPALQRIMPKPGAWMNTFKEFLAFPMLLASIWLIWVYTKQTGPIGILQILIGMSFIAFSIWLFKKSAKHTALKIIAVISLLLSLILLVIPSTTITSHDITNEEAKQFGEVFSPEKLNNLIANDDAPIFVEMTAAWCITCKANHAIAINTKSTKKAFKNNNVRYLIGDWTNQDPEITKYLNAYGRNGVPIYVFYGARDQATGKRPEAKVLPQILTPKTISNLFQ